MNPSAESQTTPKVEQTGKQQTQAGNYFVSNYPPYSFWKPSFVDQYQQALERSPLPDTPLGLYFHIPFCRKRCHFCYFKVYTDKNATAINGYLDAAIEELKTYSQKPFIGGRLPKFIYFGGGTPSYLSVPQLTQLTDRMKTLLPWDEAEEVAFECEPGTLTDQKLRAIRDIGVTRLSLGVEHFDDHILETNGRAHRSKEIEKAYRCAQDLGFPQINIDLIAGMLEETEEKCRWRLRKPFRWLLTGYHQMEVPFNTTIYRQMKNRVTKRTVQIKPNEDGFEARAIRTGRACHHQCLHGCQGQGANPLRLSGSPWEERICSPLSRIFGHIAAPIIKIMPTLTLISNGEPRRPACFSCLHSNDLSV